MLAVAAATYAQGAVAAASDRFVPTDPGFVVANVRQVIPDEELRGVIAEWRSAPEADASNVALAAAYIARARALREPGYFGRAEALLAPRAKKPGASAALRRLYAHVLQYRHEFSTAENLLDEIIREAPRDGDARVLRASIRLVRGDFSGARGDCALLAASGGGDARIGFACLAEALAGEGQVERAQALLDSVPADNADPETRAYLLATRAELRERTRDNDGAIADYRVALGLAPRDDSIRSALADALAAAGDTDAARVMLDVEKPSVALLVRAASLAKGAERAALSSRANAWLALEAARGDAMHYREAAMLALVNGDPSRALEAARRNFEVQRELPDVRVLARAARAARDPDTLQSLREWLRNTGYRDSVTEGILDSAARS
jgi:tetratricopeptide (TPR) repeat protein